jgi:hypothetical protein
MWHPEPGWQPLPSGSGASTVGVWAGTWDGTPAVIKRLARPHDPDPDVDSPQGFAYWCREADVSTERLLESTLGIRAARCLAVEEDGEGVTVVTERVQAAANNGLFLAAALGTFATNEVPDRRWWACGQLRARLRRVERRGGWRTLGRTTAADIADHLWRRRGHFLDLLDAAPQVLQHGDPTPANLRGRDRELVIGIDWGSVGLGPAGTRSGPAGAGSAGGIRPAVDGVRGGVRPDDARPGPSRGICERGLHRVHPGRLGPAASRAGGWSVGREVSPPERRDLSEITAAPRPGGRSAAVK